MYGGKKYFNNDIFFTVFKKHYCPTCETQLIRIRTSKIVNSNSPEAKNYDFSSGDVFLTGDVEFIWKDFYCTVCRKRITVSEMRQIEKEQKQKIKEAKQKEKEIKL